MFKAKNLLLIGAVAVIIATTSVTAAAAANGSTPAERAAAVTGQSVAEVTAERQNTGKSYGTIAAEAGKLSEFQQQCLQNQKTLLAERVAQGSLTQEQADALLKQMADRQANCDGSGIGAGNSAKATGSGANCPTPQNQVKANCDGSGAGQGRGAHHGGGQGQGNGNGNGLRDGSCWNK